MRHRVLTRSLVGFVALAVAVVGIPLGIGPLAATCASAAEGPSVALVVDFGDVAADGVDVFLVFEDDTEGVVDGLLVEVDGAEGEEGAGPVEGLGHARWLEEVDAAQALGEGDNLAGQFLRGLRDAGL